MKVIEAIDYNIFIGSESLKKFNFENYSRLAILVDENIKKNCLPKFLKTTNIEALIIEIPSGEKHKNIINCQYIWKILSQHNFDRKSLLINLGGGVIGDMGGFAASTYKRGIDFIQVPTTLLAMVDASVGGKLGIDFGHLKNQIGLFKNPKTVLINTVFLNTLPKTELLSGFAEVVKHALISDKEYWNHINTKTFNDLEWEWIIHKSLSIKNTIISKDPYERGERKKLNFGHTFGHAIESYYLSQEKAILHGEAIALGILLETQLSPITKQEKKEIKDFINKTFKLPKLPNQKSLIPWMLNDKKNKNQLLNFSLLTHIGKCKVNQEWKVNELFN